MSVYARGRNAFGFCMRCGFRAPLGALTDQVVATKQTGLLVCSDCLDDDHPQLLLGRYRIHDPVALRRPSPPVEYEIDTPPGAYGRRLGVDFLLGFSRLSGTTDTPDVDFVLDVSGLD
jgi:hypothetical protein